MTRTDIAALREALRAATPGPWRRVYSDLAEVGCVASGSTVVAYDVRVDADAALIALLRNEAEALLTELEAARAVVEAAGPVLYERGCERHDEPEDCRECGEHAALGAALARYRAVVGT